MARGGQANIRVGEVVSVASTTYRFSAHPAAPGVPYGQEGRSAVVYQLADDAGGLQAFKVFRNHFRTPRVAAGANQLQPFAGLPGLAVCQRTVLTPEEHAALLRARPEFSYAVVMPWIAGRTWSDVVLSKQTIAAEGSWSLAQHLVQVLAAMEARGIAHCDLSAPNLVLDLESHSVSLVDVEDLYAPGLQPPEQLPAGSDGYAHRTATTGVWNLFGDRFSGAVLLAEILGWCDERVRAAAVGERFFAREELQVDSERYRILRDVMNERWGAAIATHLERAWQSQSLNECPALTEWQASIAASSTDDLHARAAEREHLGDLEGALTLYRQAEAAAQPGALKAELGIMIAALEEKADRFASWTCVNCGASVDAGVFSCPRCGHVLDAPAGPGIVAKRSRLRLSRVVLSGAVGVLLLLNRTPRGSPVAATPPAAPAPPAPPAPPVWQVVSDTTAGLFSEPVGIAFDSHGDAYVSNNGTHSIAKLDAEGNVLDRWGSGGTGPDQLHNPGGVAVDAHDTLYVADAGNDRVLHFAADGTLINQIGGHGQFDAPHAVALDGAGNLYVADSGNHRIEKLSADGKLLASWGSFGDGPGNFNYPFGLAFDAQGNLYVADRNNDRVVKLSSEGKPLAQWKTTSFADGPLTNPSSVAVDGSGSIYVAGWASDRVQRLQKLSADGKLMAAWSTDDLGPAELSLPFQIAFDAHGTLHVAELAADRVESFTPDGRSLGSWGAKRDGDAQFRRPNNINVDAEDDVYVTDWGNERVVKLSSAPGSDVQVQAQWGPFRDLQGVALDELGNVYVTERTDCHVRKLSPTGQTMAVWGSCGKAFNQLLLPEAIAADGHGNIYVADRGNDRVAKLTASGEVVGSFGKHGSDSGEFNQPTGVAVDQSGDLYVADRDNKRIVKLSPTGQTIAVWSGLQLSAPEGVAVDSQGNVYVDDWGSSRILELAPTGALLAELGQPGSGVGQFDAPEGLAIDHHDRLYVADTGNNRVQERVQSQ
jgi:DNA-binding beta-propeller fold protein YncE